MSSPQYQNDFCSLNTANVETVYHDGTKQSFSMISEPSLKIPCKSCMEEFAIEAAACLKKLNQPTQSWPISTKKSPPEKWLVDLYKETSCQEMGNESSAHNLSVQQHPQTCKPFLEASISCVPKEEKDYMKEFQTSIADGLGLKQSIKTGLLNVYGVEAVRVGFSTERKAGYWPVIRVYPNENTCKKIKDLREKEDFVKTLCSAIKKAISAEPIKRFSDDCDYKEFATMIEVIENYPIKAPLDLSSAGKRVTTTYTTHNRETHVHTNTEWTQKAVMTCCVQNTISIGDQRYETHYLVSGFHPVIPSNSQLFRSMLPSLPNVGLHQATSSAANASMPYEWMENDISSNAPCHSAKGPVNNPYQMPCLLQASLFPGETKVAFQRMTELHEYECKISSDDHAADEALAMDLDVDHCKPERVKFLFGKAGLIKNNTSDNTYTHILIEKEAIDAAHDAPAIVPRHVVLLPLKDGSHHDSGIRLYDHEDLGQPGNNQHMHDDYIPFRSHACNVDIAIFRSCTNQQQCSIAESFKTSLSVGYHEIRLPDNIKWCGPPNNDRLEDWTGSVVFIKEGKVQKLSDRMMEFNPEYPACIWEPAANEANQIIGGEPGDSGAPVFLWREDTFHLIGILITKEHASPIGFSLELMTADIALDHCQQILDKMESELGQTYTVPASNPGEKKEMHAADDYDDHLMIDCLKKYMEILEMYIQDQRLVKELPRYKFSQLMNRSFTENKDKEITSVLKIYCN